MQVAAGPGVGRNEACPCGSGRKFKHCCGSASAPDTLAQARRMVDAGLFAEALAELERAGPQETAADGGLALARAEALLGLQRSAEAASLLKQWLAARPGDVAAWATLGLVHSARREYAQAVACLERAAALQPGSGAVHNNLGNALQEAGRAAEAAAAFRRAIQLDPQGMVAAYSNLAGTLLALGRTQEALASFVEHLSREPRNAAAYSNLLLVMHYPDGIPPVQLAVAHRRYAEQIEAPLRALWRTHPNDRDPARSLRVGFVSSDLRMHSVAFFLEPLLRHLDRQAFTPVAFSSHVARDAMTERLQPLFAEWHAIARTTDDAADRLVRERAIDILVDLNGHTAGNRLPLFARRPAPVQLSWLGYPDTTGLSAMDWRITDARADPPGVSEGWHTERLWRMDDGFLCYRPPDDAPAPALRGSAGPVVFGSMNNQNKVSAVVVEAWSRLLRQVPGSRLVMKIRGEDDPSIAEALLARFDAQGIGRERIGLLSRSAGHLEHLERYAQIDIALDTFPYNGTTTTCDALWMGVPVVALAGGHHAARVGLSLLQAVGLPELVAPDVDGYVRIAAALAADRDRLAALRAGLRAHVAASPLVDAPRHARVFGEALRAAWRDWCVRAMA